MATLTGNKIKDTYSSLIKFSDNGIASGSLQLLSDGAGNSIGISVDTSGNISSSAVGTLVGTTSSNVVNATMLDVSGNGTNGQSLLSDGDGSFSWGSPSVTIADGSITTAKLADDNVTFAKIEDRYTAKVEKSDTSGAVSIDWSAGTTFEFTASLTGATELDFTNFKQGQVIGIYGLTGSQTITLDSDAATSETFNRIGTSEYDGTGSNYLQIACVDDSATAVFNYSVITYTSDTTP